MRIWGSAAFIRLNPVLQTSTLSPSQTRSSMVQWLNPQSLTTPSCNPAGTPPSPKSSPCPFPLPATAADKPPERYAVWNMMENTAAARGRGSVKLSGSLCSRRKRPARFCWPPEKHVQLCLGAVPQFKSKNIIGEICLLNLLFLCRF